MPNIKAGQNILFLCAFLAHFGATMQEWLAQPNLSSRIGLKGFAAHLHRGASTPYKLHTCAASPPRGEALQVGHLPLTS